MSGRRTTGTRGRRRLWTRERETWGRVRSCSGLYTSLSSSLPCRAPRVGAREGDRSRRAHDPSIDSDRCRGLAPLGPRLAFFGQRRETAVDCATAVHCALCQPELYLSTQQTRLGDVGELDMEQVGSFAWTWTATSGYISEMRGRYYSDWDQSCMASNILTTGKDSGMESG